LPAVQELPTGEADYVGIMALFHRERSGEGQEVEVAMFEIMASFMLVEHANGAMFDPALGPAIYPRTIAPNRKPYRTRDGYIAVLIYNDRHRRVPALVSPAGDTRGPAADTGRAVRQSPLERGRLLRDARANSLAARGVAARQHISVAAAPCLPLMRSART
jgi:crotonobetainyl-CoA:carnitine CoA-transferase CaiB-like acyl-CoA transferase